MAQDAIKNLMGNRDAIRRLMQMDQNGQMDKIMENAKSNGTFVMNEDGGTYNAPQNRTNDSSPVMVNEQVISKHSRMPKAVLESFKKNPGQDAPLPSGYGGSVLDGLNITPVQQTIQEQTQAPTQQQISSNIDYSLIKTIIESAVKENVKKYMSALSKKLVTESATVNNDGNSLQALKIGDKFSFITKNGDIYEATLKFKRNINDAK